MAAELNQDQKDALKILEGDKNVFLTGAAGTGKSFLMRQYLKNKNIPTLASTGAAAIIVGGRTFHSFFGLGIMEGGIEATVDRVLKNKKVVKRLQSTNTVIIDEVSMLSGPTLRAAEMSLRKIRGNTTPWGGMRVIVVGDFAQLPPVNPHSREKEWLFLDNVWHESDFQPAVLDRVMRTQDPEFLEVLNHIRKGHVNDHVRTFLNQKINPTPQGDLTRLFTHRGDVEQYNLTMLERLPGKLRSFETVYSGRERDVENFRKHSPIVDHLHIKEDALVMMRQNDPEGRWVNGSLGHIMHISNDTLRIQLLTGRAVEIEMAEFTMLDAEGLPVVTATNFPISLAWGMTIHKAQGTSLDRMMVDLRKVWEPGQAYVALSRARNPNELYIEGWSERSIFADPRVTKFHDEIQNKAGEHFKAMPETTL